MLKVDFGNLTAKEKVSAVVDDDIYVVYHVAGDSLREPYLQLFEYDSAGVEYDISRAHPYEVKSDGSADGVSVTLYEDSIESDRKIDTQTVTDTSPTTGTLTFSGLTGKYELAYEVTDVGNTAAAEVAYDLFDQSNRTGVWRELSKADMLGRLATVVVPPENPYALDQGKVGYCSNVSVGFTLAWRQPRRFLEVCRAMYERGEFLSRTDHHEMSGELKRSPTPEIEDLEWMFSASLEEEGWFDQVTSTNPKDGAYNSFEKYWLTELAGYTNASVTRDVNAPEVSVRNVSNNALDNDGSAILGIDGSMVDSRRFLNRPTGKAINQMTLTHAVTLTAKFQTNSGNIDYSIHTWGNRVNVRNHSRAIVNGYLFDTVQGWR